MKRRALAVVGCVGLVTMAFDPGMATEPSGPRTDVPPPVAWVCETHSVVVAPEAASSKGTFKLRTTPESGTAGTWAALELAESHKGSFVARYPVCATACAYTATVNATRLELWAPKKVAPASLPAGEPMSVATLDLTTGSLRVSTFIDNAIAALEQGTCKAGD